MQQQHSAAGKSIEYIDIASPKLSRKGTIRDDLIDQVSVYTTRAGYDIWADIVRAKLTE